MCLSQESHANVHNHHFHRHHLFLRLCTHRGRQWLLLFKSCHTFFDYLLDSTFLSRCCHHHLQGKSSCHQSYCCNHCCHCLCNFNCRRLPWPDLFQPGAPSWQIQIVSQRQWPGVQLLAPLQEFQDISFHSAVSLCTDPKFYPDKTEVRTFFFTKNCVCNTGKILTPGKNVLITDKSHVP